MKFLILTHLIFALVIASQAAIHRGLYQDPAHPGKCVMDGKILSPGEHDQNPEGCGRRICGSGSMVEFHSCSVEVPPIGYKLGDPIMPTEPYPDCCRKAFIPIV
ncbi:uncharacterized protein ACRADG_009803 isoform 2-T2 [Cochliomyia hominivorax]